jgi:hypothetical protein
MSFELVAGKLRKNGIISLSKAKAALRSGKEAQIYAVETKIAWLSLVFW